MLLHLWLQRCFWGTLGDETVLDCLCEIIANVKHSESWVRSAGWQQVASCLISMLDSLHLVAAVVGDGSNVSQMPTTTGSASGRGNKYLKKSRHTILFTSKNRWG